VTTYTLTPLQPLHTYAVYDGKADVVFKVNWQYAADDGAHAATMMGETLIPYVKEAPFTPYADLKSEQVAGWVTDAWGAKITAANKATLDADLQKQAGPQTRLLPLPWKVGAADA
jgi:hypothetical protein